MIHRLAAVLFTLLCAACTQYSLVGPGRTTVEGMTLEPGIAWNRATGLTTGPGTETWTMDGPLLDSLIILAAVPDGKPLALLRGASTDKLAPFRKTMTANEVMDLFEASFSAESKTTVLESRNLRPVSFGGTEGFRFEASYTGANEVESEMAIAGAISGGKLYLLVYRGARLHYFPKYLPDFERIVASARLPGA
jgi:hypothetical protein